MKRKQEKAKGATMPKPKRNPYAGIPENERAHVRTLFHLYEANRREGEKLRTPEQVYRSLIEGRKAKAREEAKEKARKEKEQRRYQRESAKAQAQQALSTLLRAWWLAKALEEEQEMEPALNEQDAAMFIRMAIKEAGEKLEDALVTFEVLSAAEADAFRE